MEASAESRKHIMREWGEDCWAIIFALFREYNLQRLQSMHEDSTEGDEVKRQQRMKVMKEMMKKIRPKERIDAGNRLCVAEFLAADCENAWLHPGEGRHQAKNGMFGWINEKGR